MATLGQMIPKIFIKAWRRYGRPKMAVVRPIAQWLLPDGFSYDDRLDLLQDAAGTVLTNPEAYWTMDYIYMVPAQRTVEQSMLTAIGALPPGLVRVGVLAADLPLVEAAYAVQVDGVWYDVVDSGHTPPGGGTAGLWAELTLQRRS